MATSPRHIFAIKALAVRTHDIDDLRLLAGIVSALRRQAIIAIYAATENRQVQEAQAT
jgi:hypothetical protein